MACTICNDDEPPHKMRYRLQEITSQACEACLSSGPLACSWRGKTLSCLEYELVSIYTARDHATAVSSPKKKKLTSTQKAFCRELADHHLKPMRIRNRLSKKFGMLLQDLPELGAVQNFVNHYTRTTLSRNDRVDDLRKWIHARAFSGGEAMTQSFSFGWDLDQDGKPVVGNGSDQRPFVIRLTTKALVTRLMLPPESFILHVDATYKRNYREYPVLVVGVSDRSRGFHLVALYIVSQETQAVVQPALMALRRLYFWITSRELVVHYAMADADQAQHNALNAVFGGGRLSFDA
ncbi:Intraflagellar Transport Protein 52 [Phytophthora cinnamomi]|uniref:Intraflagellar Transport Protein 52 n=1 Tax=Phytophthora cinnamomi TaxID=4785 RepID=UPI00355A4A3B|nr:Intraflagellar Transport Protein 52 [Phytophthora cinnamomi]